MSKFDNKADWFFKYDTENFDVQFNFTNDLATGETLSSCTATVLDVDGTAVSGMVSSVSVSTPSVTFDVDGGTAGDTYQIKIAGVSSASNTFVHYITFEVYGSLTLNSKLGDSSANSYVTLKQANDYVRNKYGSSNTWDELSDNGKKRILIEAADMLNRFNFIEGKYYNSQALSFPLTTHDVVTGNCGTPFTTTSFRNSGLYSTTYGEMPTDYWEYGSVHITSGTPIREIRRITNSDVTTGSITVDTAYTTAPNANSKFIAFEPIADEIMDAQCEQALFILDNSKIANLHGYKDLGAESIKIGDAAITLTSGNMNKLSLAPISKKLLSRWIKKSLRVARG
jgi:hypothetical protein